MLNLLLNKNLSIFYLQCDKQPHNLILLVGCKHLDDFQCMMMKLINGQFTVITLTQSHKLCCRNNMLIDFPSKIFVCQQTTKQNFLKKRGTTKQVMCNVSSSMVSQSLLNTNRKTECFLLYTLIPKEKQKFKKACSFRPLNKKHMPIYVLLRVHFTTLNQPMHSARDILQ